MSPFIFLYIFEYYIIKKYSLRDMEGLERADDLKKKYVTLDESAAEVGPQMPNSLMLTTMNQDRNSAIIPRVSKS